MSLPFVSNADCGFIVARFSVLDISIPDLGLIMSGLLDAYLSRVVMHAAAWPSAY